MRITTHPKISILLPILIFALLSPAITARIITVDNDAPADFTNIQAAINDANHGDIVLVAPGTYTGPGNFGINFLGKAITVRSQTCPENCIIAGESVGSAVYFDRGETDDSVLEGFKLINAKNTPPRLPLISCRGSSPSIINCIITGNHGDGIRGSDSSSPTITDCTISDNSDWGIRLSANINTSNCTPKITNCIISGNQIDGINISGGSPLITDCTIRGNLGYGIYCQDTPQNAISPTITDCSISDNTGSGIYCNSTFGNGGVPTINGCSITNNTNSGIACQTATITNCTISGNSGLFSGGIGCSDYPTIINCTITNNSAYYDAGGIGRRIDPDVPNPSDVPNPTIIKCKISNNSVAMFGAGAIYANQLKITDSVITGNSGGFCGGIVCGGNTSFTSSINNCLIAGNSASGWPFPQDATDAAGGILLGRGNLIITNSILWGNESPVSPELYLYGDCNVSVTYSDIHGGPNDIYVSSNSTLNWGPDNIDADPRFADADNNDFHLLPASPCIDAGDPNYKAEPNETDFEGNPRVVNGIIDMGPYEADNINALSLDLSIDHLWMYQNLPAQTNSNLTATVSITDDPNNNTSYSYHWQFILPDDVTTSPTITTGGTATDTFCTFSAPACNVPNGISDSGQAFKIRVIITGNDFGNIGTAELQFGIALLGDVNNDGRVNVADRSITNAFWRTGSAGAFTLRDCDLNCDGVVNVADRSIADAIWRGTLGQNKVTIPCPLR